MAALLGVTLFGPGSSDAIVRRHDVRDSGYLAVAGEYPFVFGVYEPQPGQKDCLGTLIDQYWAVTAAHCTTFTPLMEMVANGGTDVFVAIGEGRFAIDRIVRHPSWHGQLAGAEKDIALIKFKAPVESVPVIPLYEALDEVGKTVRFVGWGATGTGVTGAISDDYRFRLADNRVDSADDVLLFFKFDDPRSATGTALPLEGIGGTGDSGGPALMATPGGWALAGISSAQKTVRQDDGTMAAGVYGAIEYYTRVSTTVGWIRSVIGQGGDGPASGH